MEHEVQGGCGLTDAKGGAGQLLERKEAGPVAVC